MTVPINSATPSTSSTPSTPSAPSTPSTASPSAASGEAPTQVSPEARREAMRRLVRRNVSTVLLDVVVPMAVYYVLRGFGVDQWWSLILGIVAATPRALVEVVRRRRVDLVAFFTVSVLVFSLAIGLLTGSARALAVRESFVNVGFGLLGLWMVVSVLVDRPVMMVLGRTIAVSKVGEEGARRWERRWARDAGFRHGIRVISNVWGVGLFVDAVLTVALAYTLPIDLISLVTHIQWYGVLAVLVAFHCYYVRKADIDA